ncbi:hypothetical protein PENSPDRAFT_689226 [Peniophora sp. CONT]|nr:hypothetical protein PENSPDRAFT_689226 [Peniophora sp. CONT]
MTETPLEDREKILKRHGWTHCEADTPYHDIWTNFWGITPRKRFQKVQGWPEWVEALEPENLDLEGELGELAEDHELYPEDIAEVGFYDLGDICPLRPTRGRITLVSQHKTLLTELLDRVKYDTQRQGVIVTGQPGIGITYSMHTILVSCLYREIPLLVSMDNTTHYLFLDIGVWELCGGLDTLNDSSAAAYRRAIGGKKTPWALFDGDTQEPPGAFTKAYVFWPVLFVPPDLGHYDTWLRQRSPALIVMEPMQTKEILKWWDPPCLLWIVFVVDFVALAAFCWTMPSNGRLNPSTTFSH